jgi:hypothetical protein
VKRWCGFSTMALEVLQRLYPATRHLAAACLPFWFPSPEARRQKERRRMDDFLWLAMQAPGRNDLKALRKRCAPENREMAFASVGIPVPMERSTEPPVENFLAMRTTKVSNLISFNALEKWQTGDLSLDQDPRLAKLAA